MSHDASSDAPIRVLLLISSLLGGGAERVAASLANDWVREGKVVRLVTLESERSDFYVLDPRVARVALSLAEPSSGLWATLKNNATRIRAVRRQLLEFRPDVAVGFMTVSSVLLAVSALGLDCKTLGTERSHPPATPLGFIRETARTISYRALDGVLALTDQSAEWIREHTLAKTIRVIPNAARWPLHRQDPVVSPDVACRPGRNVLLAVGRLDPVKGYPDLLEVFSRLSPKHVTWDLVILGEGEQRRELENLVVRLKLNGRVFFPGIVGNVADWYERATIYVMTSKYEGFPNTLVEAMSCGLPSVSFDCDVGPRNIIRPEVDGELVPNGNLNALEHALDRLMRDEPSRARYAACATDVRKRFGQAQILKSWHDLLTTLAEQRRSKIGAHAK